MSDGFVNLVIVGSSLTGYSRAGSASHSLSGVYVTIYFPPPSLKKRYIYCGGVFAAVVDHVRRSHCVKAVAVGTVEPDRAIGGLYYPCGVGVEIKRKAAAGKAVEHDGLFECAAVHLILYIRVAADRPVGGSRNYILHGGRSAA